MQDAKIERILTGGMVVLCLALCWVVYDTIHERIVNVGDTAPNFKILSDGGQQLTRSHFGGKLLVLNFWATWCPPCVEEMPSLSEFQKKLAGKGVVVVGISVDRNENAYRTFLNRQPVTFQTARDPRAEISAEYGTFKYPETYIIDQNGRVVQKHIGPRDWSDETLIQSIQSML